MDGTANRVWVLTFQTKIGESWPHWHILTDLPSGGIDLARAWKLWRDRWGRGGLDLQRKDWTADSEAALLYISKYLVKYPEAGFPAWVELFERRIRWIQASKAVGALLPQRPKPMTNKWAAPAPSKEIVLATDAEAAADHRHTETPDGPEVHPHGYRNYATRKADCYELVNFFEVTQVNGIEHHRFAAQLPCELVVAALGGVHGLTLHTTEEDKDYLIGEWETFRKLYSQILDIAASRLPPGGILAIARKRTARLPKGWILPAQRDWTLPERPKRKDEEKPGDQAPPTSNEDDGVAPF